MPIPKNIAAYTPPTNPYPPYVSINETGPGCVTITVRNKPNAAGECGATAEIELSQEDFIREISGPIRTWVDLLRITRR